MLFCGRLYGLLDCRSECPAASVSFLQKRFVCGRKSSLGVFQISGYLPSTTVTVLSVVTAKGTFSDL